MNATEAYKQAMQLTRPPLGITPRYIWLDQRRDDIKAAIVRMMEANRYIPTDWVTEYNDLMSK